ncbi:MAG TPA: PIG-L deacetylase family protein [Acidimicrobiia bacterium]|nr:PIG-L deacetylase family protein [Acidimicrobiia bacterium]
MGGSELSVDLPTPRKALTIGAHPDDAEYAAGGTLAKWARGGCEVSMIVLTDGSKGSWDLAVTPGQLSKTRELEQRRSFETLGATGELVMLGHPDGHLDASPSPRETLCLWIRRLRPDVVLTHDPWRRYEMHSDHRAAGWAAVDAVVAARDHLFYPEQLGDGLSKHRPRNIMLWNVDEPDHWEDVSGSIDIKARALKCHESQMLTTPVPPGELDRVLKGRAAASAPNGLELAEAFKLLVP